MFNEAKALKSLGRKPLVVVSAIVGEQRGWAAAQNEAREALDRKRPSDGAGRDTRVATRGQASRGSRVTRSRRSFRPPGRDRADATEEASGFRR